MYNEELLWLQVCPECGITSTNKNVRKFKIIFRKSIDKIKMGVIITVRTEEKKRKSKNN